MSRLILASCFLFLNAAFADWLSPPHTINANAGDQDPHFNSGARRVVRINGTTLALAPMGYQQDYVYRSHDNGNTWELLDQDGNYSGCLITGPDSMVYHVYADWDAGALKLARFKYNAASVAAPTAIYSNSALSTSKILHEYRSVNAIVDSAGSLYVAAHWGSPDRMYAFRSDDRGDTWSGPFQISADNTLPWYYPHLEVDARGGLMATYQQDGGAEMLMFARSADRGRTWSNALVQQVTDGDYAFNPSLLAGGGDTVYIFHQGHEGVDGVFVTRSTDGGATWGPHRLIEQTCGYGDPSASIGSDGALYAAFRSSRNTGVTGGCGDASREKLALSTDKGATWRAVDSLYPPAMRTGTRSQMRYQTWWNYGGPLEWIWTQYEPDGRDIDYDVNLDVTLFDRMAAGSSPGSMPNRAPVIDSIQVDENPMARDDSSTWRVWAHDPDGDPLSYQWLAGGVTAGSAAAYVFHGGDCGMSVGIEVRVFDGKGGSASRTAVQNFAAGSMGSSGLVSPAPPDRFRAFQDRDAQGRALPILRLLVPAGAAGHAFAGGVEVRLLSAEGKLVWQREWNAPAPGRYGLSLLEPEPAPAGRYQAWVSGRGGQASFPVLVGH